LQDELARLTEAQEGACDWLASDMAARRVAFAQERARVEQALPTPELVFSRVKQAPSPLPTPELLTVRPPFVTFAQERARVEQARLPSLQGYLAHKKHPFP
jgi:hypothetical protein